MATVSFKHFPSGNLTTTKAHTKIMRQIGQGALLFKEPNFLTANGKELYEVIITNLKTPILLVGK